MKTQKQIEAMIWHKIDNLEKMAIRIHEQANEEEEKGNTFQAEIKRDIGKDYLAQRDTLKALLREIQL